MQLPVNDLFGHVPPYLGYDLIATAVRRKRSVTVGAGRQVIPGIPPLRQN